MKGAGYVPLTLLAIPLVPYESYIQNTNILWEIPKNIVISRNKRYFDRSINNILFMLDALNLNYTSNDKLFLSIKQLRAKFCVNILIHKNYHTFTKFSTQYIGANLKIFIYN